MRLAFSLFALAFCTGVVHDLTSESCRRWYRLPLQLASDFVFPDLPFGHPLYELAYGASKAQDKLVAYRLSSPGLLVPSNFLGGSWEDVQTGAYTVIPGPDIVVLKPPFWLDQKAFVADFEASNPAAVRLGSSSSTIEPFVLVQVGGGVEGLEIQAVLEKTGRATVWIVEEDPRSGRYVMREVVQEMLETDVTEGLSASAGHAVSGGTGLVYWNCAMLDGCARTLTVFDGQKLSSVQWANCREPDASASRVISRLLGLAPTHAKRWLHPSQAATG